jgi:hypothetical protein
MNSNNENTQQNNNSQHSNIGQQSNNGQQNNSGQQNNNGQQNSGQNDNYRPTLPPIGRTNVAPYLGIYTVNGVEYKRVGDKVYMKKYDQ